LSSIICQPLPVQPWTVVLVLAVLGFVPINMSAARAYQEAEVTPGNQAQDANAKSARLMGFKASRNMSLCMGSFGLLGLVQIATSLANTSTSVIAKAFGLVDDAESFAFVGLLAALNRSSLRALVATATDATELKESDYVVHHGAEIDFYEKLGDVFRTQAVLKILTYVVSVAKYFLR